MEEMLPYLCRRRKEQYYAVVKSIGNGPKNWSPPLSKQTKDKTSRRSKKPPTTIHVVVQGLINGIQKNNNT